MCPKTRSPFFDTLSGKTVTTPNTTVQLKRFAKAYSSTCLAICEATGGYETTLLNVLIDLNIPAHRADALKVKAFIRSFGTLGKSDAIDAKGLAAYGQERHQHLTRWKPQDPSLAELHTLVERRVDLVTMRQAEKNRAKAPGVKAIAKSIRQVISLFDKQITELEKRIKDLVEQSECIKQTVKTLTSLKGIGMVTAVSLCAFMPELGTLTRRQAAALAGLAPHPNQSGSLDKYRRVRGGRPQIRKTLFMPALVAVKHNPRLKAFYEKLISEGKKPIVAITATM